MKKTILIILIGLVFASSTVFAQVRMPPKRQQQAPFGRNVTGFMQLQFGLTTMPILDLAAESRIPDVDFTLRDAKPNIPGFTAAMFFIPTWGHNGISFGASYDLTGASFSQTVDTRTAETYEGNSKVGMASFALRLGYIRYFGDFEWHPYVLTDAGLAWETIMVESTYKNADDEVKEGKANSGVFSAGFGIGREISNGMVGGEIRADYYPFPVKGDYNDPVGKFDLETWHPLIIKFQVFFALGQL